MMGHATKLLILTEMDLLNRDHLLAGFSLECKYLLLLCVC